MKKLLLLALLALWPAHAKAQVAACNSSLTQTAVLSSFADNIPGGITPRNLRDYVCSLSNSIFPTLGRVKLLADVNLYVSTAGSDTSNTCLVSGAPCKTIQYATNIAETYDFNGHQVFINIGSASGAQTFTEAVTTSFLVGGGHLFYQGANATQTNTVWNATTGSTLLVAHGGNTQVHVQGLEIENNSAGNGAIDCQYDSVVVVGNITFGPTTFAHIFNHDNACVVLSDGATQTIIGTTSYHLYTKGGYIFEESDTITIGASGNLNTYAAAVTSGVIQATGTTYINNGTVVNKYYVQSSASINTQGGGLSYFPGTFAGIAGSNATYVDEIPSQVGIPLLFGANNTSFLTATTSGSMIYWNGGGANNNWQVSLGAQQGNIWVAGAGGVPSWGGLTNTTSNITVDKPMSQFTFVDGPQVAQGTAGTWYACGTLMFTDSAGAASFQAKLYDGTTTIAVAEHYQAGTNVPATITLCGVIANPAGNLRMAGYDQSSNSGVIKATTPDGGFTPVSKITVFRIN